MITPNEELVLKIQNGEKNLQEELYLNVKNLIGQTTYKFYERNRSLIDKFGSIDYDDVLQLANLSFMKCIHKFKIDKGFQFTTFLVNAIQLNLHNEFYRNKKISNRYQKDLVYCEYKDNLVSINDLGIEDKILLEQLMSVLTDKEKDIIIDKYLIDMKNQDLLNKYGISNQMINSIRKKALDKMRKEMERNGI